MSYQINHTKYLSDSEAHSLEVELWNALSRDSRSRDSLLLLLLLYTGARCSEALAVRWEWLDVSKKTVLIRGVKGSNDREVPIPNALIEALLRFRGQGGHLGTARIFAISYSRLKAIWSRYRPNGKKLHSLRHTFAIRQLKKHGRIDVIKRLLGHKNIANTMIYADYAFTDAELRALVAPDGVLQSPGTLARKDFSTARLKSTSVPPKVAGKC